MRTRSRRHGVVFTTLSTIPAVPTLSAIPAIPAFSGVFRSGSCIAGAGACGDTCAGTRADDDACRHGAAGRIIKLLAVVERADDIPVIGFEICYVRRSSIQSPE